MPLVPASWGGLPKASHALLPLHDRERLPVRPASSLLAYGNGRSYGDSCLNDGGTLLLTRGLDRFIAFDAETGILECETGVLLAEIIALALPKGWFLPVTPGTRFVTVGGAIANDVHGKNHHRLGSFGRHVLSLYLWRSDSGPQHCSATENAELFAASIGGLGLTGLILTARLQLRRVPGPMIEGESIKFGSLKEFFSLSAESDASAEYSVAWVDCLAGGAARGRGLFMRGNHSLAQGPLSAKGLPLAMPFQPPFSLVNKLSLHAFNALYYRKQTLRQKRCTWHYQPFFYPLDGIAHWNRMYGPKGFYQYQCVVPMAVAEDALDGMLKRIAESGQGSFLAVLKVFGRLPSPGLMSFSRPGATLALDFPNRGSATTRLLDELDRITMAADGAVYPAKDARMNRETFARSFGQLARFERSLDPAFSSSFWRRVRGTAGANPA